MPLNKKISIFIIIVGFVIVGIYAWKNYINIGILAFQGEIPFSVQVDEKSLACSSDSCEINVAPGKYGIKIQKTDYEDIEQTVEVNRGEKLIVSGKFKKKISLSDGMPINEKYRKILGRILPLELAYDTDLQQKYDAIFQLMKDMKGSKKDVIFQKHNSVLQMSLIVFTDKNVYFVAPDFKKPVDLTSVISAGSKVAISPFESSIVFIDNKGKNQSLKVVNIDQKGGGFSAPAVLTYFSKPITADYLSFSNNGKFVFAVDKSASVNSIYKIDISGKTKENIANFDMEIYGIKPSFDGKYVLAETSDLKSYTIDTKTRIGKIIDVKNLRLDFTAWTSRNSVVMVYPETNSTTSMSYEDAIKTIETGATTNSTAFTRVSEYFPETSMLNGIRDLATLPKFPSQMDFAEISDLRRVMVLSDNKIYNLDYTVK